MKKVLSYFAIALIVASSAADLFAQGARIVERVYIATDKQSYIAGDRVWCSVYCFEAGEELVMSDFSSTVYLELQDRNQVVLTAKVALTEGRGAGAIELPPTLPTGNYKLLGYTTQNRNEEGFSPEGKIISIYNVMTAERVEGNVELTHKGIDVAIPVAQGNVAIEREKGGVVVELPTVEVKKGEEFHLKLKNGTEESASLSLSVYHTDPFVTRIDSGIVNFWEKAAHTSFGAVTGNLLPDYEGEVVRLNVSGGNDERMYVSFPGVHVDTYSSEVDDDGRAFIVTPNVYGDRDMVCEGGSAVSLQDPFIREVKGDIPQLRLYPEMEEVLTRRGFSMQVGRRFDADTLYEKLPVRANILLDANKVTYILDDYTRFPKMQEVLDEFVSEIRVRTVKKQKLLSIMVKTVEGTYYANGYSLVMLDGVPVTDQSKILDYDPLLLHRIEIYTGLYSIGNMFCEGVANFITYKGDMTGYDFGDNVKILPYKGAIYPLAFTGSRIQAGGAYPDYRETIYWHPLLEMERGSEEEIRCIAPMYSGDFEIVLEGVTRSGNPIFYKSTLKIR